MEREPHREPPDRDADRDPDQDLANSNDPVAILLVVGFIEWIGRPDYGAGDMLLTSRCTCSHPNGDG